MSQNTMIAVHLKTYGSIMPIDARKLYGCDRLAARIHELREQGMKIDTLIQQVKTRNGKARVAEYILRSKANG
jgi:hypothetical protein